MGNTSLSSGVYHDEKAFCSVFWRRGVHSRAPLWWIVMEYTYEYGCMRLTLVTVIAGLVLRKRNTQYVFLVRSSPFDFISTTEAVFSWERSVVNVCRPRTVRTPICEDAIIAVVEREPVAHTMSHENWDFSNRESSKYVLTIWIHTVIHRTLVSCFAVVLSTYCTCNYEVFVVW